MKDELITLLGTYGYPVIQQGSLEPNDPYPDVFFTFWNSNTPGTAFYDNRANAFIWHFDLCVYSTDPDSIETLLLDVRRKLRTNGWSVDGLGYDAASDESTHIGRGIHISRREKNTEV